LYALLLCALAPLRPLWLDELLQLSDTWHHSLTQTLNSVAHNPGGVPLAYLAENLFVNEPGVRPRKFDLASALVTRHGRLAASGAGVRAFANLTALRRGSKAVWARAGVEHRGDRIARLA
jgi:hypothetical protein